MWEATFPLAPGGINDKHLSYPVLNGSGNLKCCKKPWLCGLNSPIPGFPPGKLKKTILEDREYRAPGSVLPLAENAPRPVRLVAAPAVVEPFMPSWCMEEEDWLVVSDYPLVI